MLPVLFLRSWAAQGDEVAVWLQPRYTAGIHECSCSCIDVCRSAYYERCLHIYKVRGRHPVHQCSCIDVKKLVLVATCEHRTCRAGGMPSAAASCGALLFTAAA